MDVSHACILPRVLYGIGENDIGALDVETTIKLVVKVNIRRSNSWVEDLMAVIYPILRPKEL